MHHPRRIPEAATRSLPLLVALVAVGTLAAQDLPAITDAPGDAKLEKALEQLNIPAALSVYDARAAEGGPSRDLLERIGRSNLHYCLDEGTGWARFEAARLLSSLEDPAGRRALLEYLDTRQQVFRVRAMEVAAEQGLKGALPKIRAIAEDGSRVVYERIVAALALHRLGEVEPARSVLLTLCGNEMDRDRMQAVGALATVASPETRDALAARLGDAFLIALRAAEGLARLGDARGIDFLVASLSRENMQQTVAVVAAMAAAGVSAGGETIRAILDEMLPAYSEPKADKLDVLIYLYSWVDPAAASPYVDRMLKVEDWPHGRYLGARRLAELGDERALPVLVALFHSEAARTLPAYRTNVVRAAGWFGDRPEVRELAVEALDDVDRHARQQAIDLLARLGDPRSLGPAREVLGAAELLPRVNVTRSLVAYASGPLAPPGRPSEDER